LIPASRLPVISLISRNRFVEMQPCLLTINLMSRSQVEAAVKRDAFAADFIEPTTQPKQQSSHSASSAAPPKAKQ
jgi:hypothetical protein